jgi:cbb3-type cytochrome oxidase maturation protein
LAAVTGSPDGLGYSARNSFQVLYDKNHVRVELLSCFILFCLNTFNFLKQSAVSVLILLLIASLSVSVIFLGAFIWSLRNKQFDDEYSSSMRILFDDQPVPSEEKKEIQISIQPVSKFKQSDNISQRLN